MPLAPMTATPEATSTLPVAPDRVVPELNRMFPLTPVEIAFALRTTIAPVVVELRPEAMVTPPLVCAAVLVV